jgi:hypothetical protein
VVHEDLGYGVHVGIEEVQGLFRGQLAEQTRRADHIGKQDRHVGHLQAGDEVRTELLLGEGVLDHRDRLLP